MFAGNPTNAKKLSVKARLGKSDLEPAVDRKKVFINSIYVIVAISQGHCH